MLVLQYVGQMKVSKRRRSRKQVRKEPQGAKCRRSGSVLLLAETAEMCITATATKNWLHTTYILLHNTTWHQQLCFSCCDSQRGGQRG
jgi:hypothetical protein